MADPVQDFLARERNALAELEGDDVPDVVDHPVANDVENGFDAFQQVPPQINGILNSGGDSGVDLAALNLNGESPIPTQNGRGPSPTVSISSMRSQEPLEEPEKIKKWREDQKKRLEEKDAAEEKKKREMREQAKKELEEWNKQRLTKVEDAKKKNRDRETSWQKNGDVTKEGEQWDQIAKMVESGPKTNKNTKDTSRMKELILQMIAETNK